MSDLFRTYERVKTERVEVATITEHNIHQIAQMVKGCVDYSEDAPFITEPYSTSKMRWKVGHTVQILGDRLNNMSGFNYNGHWKEVPNE